MVEVKPTQKLLISNLIFYTVYPEKCTIAKPNEINDALYERIEKLQGNLSIDQVYKIINQEKYDIRRRGNNVSNYLFGKDKGLYEAVKFFYNGLCTRTEINFPYDTYIDIFGCFKDKPITISEIVLITALFSRLSYFHSEKLKVMKKEEKKNDDLKREILFNEKIGKKYIEEKEKEELLAACYSTFARASLCYASNKIETYCLHHRSHSIFSNNNFVSSIVKRILNYELKLVHFSDYPKLAQELGKYNDINFNASKAEYETAEECNIEYFPRLYKSTSVIR